MNPPGRTAFSLVEVVLALGICAFVLVALIGLFSVGLKSSRESEDQIQAANLASQIIAFRLASPTNAALSAIPAGLTTNYSNQYIDFNGMLTNAGAAAYRVTCQAGTNAISGSQLSQVYLMLSWPPQASSTNAAGRYEVVTYLPLH